MYKSAEELISKNIPIITRNSICNMIEMGIFVYKGLRKDNELLFSNILGSNINQRLLSYCITRQFGPDMIDKEIQFISSIRSVNTFGYKVVELKNEKLILHISRSKNLLPNKANYKLDLSSNNDFKSNQQIMQEFENGSIRVFDTPYYAFINYFINKKDELEYVNIVVPNHKMDEVIYSERIYNKNNTLKLMEDINIDEVEKRIVTIKEEIKHKNVL